MRAQVSCYRDCLNAFIGESQLRCQYHSNFFVHVGQDGHYLHHVDEKSYGVCGSHTLLAEGGHSGNAVVFLPSIAGLL